MYNIKLDNNGYFTGAYAVEGTVEGGVDAKTIPSENDPLKVKAYKYSDGMWSFDKARYDALLLEESQKPVPPSDNDLLRAEVEELKKKIAQLESALGAK